MSTFSKLYEDINALRALIVAWGGNPKTHARAVQKTDEHYEDFVAGFDRLVKRFKRLGAHPYGLEYWLWCRLTAQHLERGFTSDDLKRHVDEAVKVNAELAQMFKKMLEE